LRPGGGQWAGEAGIEGRGGGGVREREKEREWEREWGRAREREMER